MIFSPSWRFRRGVQHPFGSEHCPGGFIPPRCSKRAPTFCSEASKQGRGQRGDPVASHPQHPLPGMLRHVACPRHVSGDEASEVRGVSLPGGPVVLAAVAALQKDSAPGRRRPPHRGAGHPWQPGARWPPRGCCGSAWVSLRGWGRAARPCFGEVSGCFGATGCWCGGGCVCYGGAGGE